MKLETRNFRNSAIALVALTALLAQPALVNAATVELVRPSLNDLVSAKLGYRTGRADVGSEYARTIVIRDVDANPVIAKRIRKQSKDLKQHVLPALTFFSVFGFSRVCHDRAGSLYGSTLPQDATCSGDCSGLARNKQTYLADGLVCQTETTQSPGEAESSRRLSCYDAAMLSDEEPTPSIDVSLRTPRSGAGYSIIVKLSSVIAIAKKAPAARTDEILKAFGTDFDCIDISTK